MLSIGSPPPNTHRPGPLQELAPLPSPRRRWLILPLLLAATLVGLFAWSRLRPANAVDELHLTGPRTPTAICLHLLLDESGSFDKYEAVRRNAMDQILDWSVQNLRPDDCIAITSFAGSAHTKMENTTIKDIAAGNYKINPSQRLADGTQIQPALIDATSQIKRPIPASLIVVSDTEVSDATGAVAGYLVALNATTMTLILPRGAKVTDSWAKAFPYESVVVAGSDSANETAIALGKAIAHATNQDLTKN